MKSIYISLPITGQEDTYDARLNAAVAYVNARLQQFERIITPKDVAEKLEDDWNICKMMLSYRDYLLKDLLEIAFCDAIFLCDGWEHSKGCQAEHAFARAIGIDILFQPM